VTSIGRSDGGAIGTGYDVPRNRQNTGDMDEDVTRRSGARTSLGGGLMTDLGFGADDQTLAEGRTAFEERLRQAARTVRGEAEGASDAAAVDMLRDARVLALVEGMSATGLPLPADAAPPATQTATPAAEGLAAQVTARIEQAIRAEAAPVQGRPVNLRIPLDGTIDGLKAIRIVATPTTLDVVLERAGTDVSPDLVQAAEALAGRLAARFAKRTVRVMDLPSRPAADKAEHAGAQALSDLFRQTTG
jgi:hypothetical protein